MGSGLKNYSFNKYYVTKKKEHTLCLEKLEVISENAELISGAYKPLAASVEGVFLARDLATEPANVIYPASFALQCQELTKLGVKVTVLDERQMRDLGMGALLGVGQASATESRTVVMEWKPANYPSDGVTIAVAGKGVCFDSGGLNIKSASSHIADMKDDKAGAAVVTGTMHTVAKRKLNVHVVGIIGLVENMIAGNAMRPSDVINTMSGQTVEVENTDAEGRLVLCDIMWYVQEHYKPHYLLDIATLTGAVTMALGENGYAGLFSNDDEMADDILKLGKKTGEIFWRLPMADHFDKQIDSEIADMRNTGTARGAGATIAAQFLQRFVQKGC
jgi:leucyl aminopeptidase